MLSYALNKCLAFQNGRLQMLIKVGFLYLFHFGLQVTKSISFLPILEDVFSIKVECAVDMFACGVGPFCV